MTDKKPTAAEKEAAAQKKADEVAALIGDDVKASATQKPTAPPEIKNSTESKGAEKAATEKAATEKAATEKAATEKAATEKAATEKAATEKAATEKVNSNVEQLRDKLIKHNTPEKASCMVILSKTIHTKDADGNDVKFIASKNPQDLGEYAEMAIKAKCAKPHKAG
jgi:membrane protein involved in colicin uptake